MEQNLYHIMSCDVPQGRIRASQMYWSSYVPVAHPEIVPLSLCSPPTVFIHCVILVILSWINYIWVKSLFFVIALYIFTRLHGERVIMMIGFFISLASQTSSLVFQALSISRQRRHHLTNFHQTLNIIQLTDSPGEKTLAPLLQ